MATLIICDDQEDLLMLYTLLAEEPCSQRNVTITTYPHAVPFHEINLDDVIGIISDGEMPGTNGGEAARIAREKGYTKPYYLNTAQPDLFDYYKPFVTEILYKSGSTEPFKKALAHILSQQF